MTDFLALLQQHTRNQSPNKIINETEIEIDDNDEFNSSTLNALDKPLSSSRYNDEDRNDRSGPLNNNFRSHQHHRSNFRNQNKFNQQRGRRSYTREPKRRRRWSFSDLPHGPAYEREDTGEFFYEGVHGKYDIWRSDWAVAGAHKNHAGEWVSNDNSGLVVLFEAKAANDITFALSPAQETCGIPGMYEVVVGGWNDTKSIIRREAQGEEKAALHQYGFHLCNPNEFVKFYALQIDDLILVGLVDETEEGAMRDAKSVAENVVGKKVLLKWNDEDFFACKFVGFSGWDKVNIYRNVKVFSAAELGFDPEKLSRLKMSLEFVDFAALKTKNVDGMKIDSADGNTLKNERNNISGFDIFTEEEKEKKEKRMERFKTNFAALKSEETDSKDVELMKREKLEERAKRFNIPITEDQRLLDHLFTGVKDNEAFPRKDRPADGQIRKEAIYIYGNFDGKYTEDIYGWFEEYGNGSNIKLEWLHDFALNVIFENSDVATRAFNHLAKEIPNFSTESFQQFSSFEDNAGKIKLLEELRINGWRYLFKADGDESLERMYLFRYSSVTDVKEKKDDEYRTHGNFPGDRRKELKLLNAKKRKRESMEIEDNDGAEDMEAEESAEEF